MSLTQDQFFLTPPLDLRNMSLVDFVNILHLNGHQGWGNLLSGLGGSAGRTWGTEEEPL